MSDDAELNIHAAKWVLIVEKEAGTELQI